MSLTAPARYSNRPGVSLHAQNSYKVRPSMTIYHGALVGIGKTGVPVYASDENTFTVTATSNVGAVGELVRCDTAGIGDVRLFTPTEYLALESLGKV